MTELEEYLKEIGKEIWISAHYDPFASRIILKMDKGNRHERQIIRMEDIRFRYSAEFEFAMLRVLKDMVKRLEGEE